MLLHGVKKLTGLTNAKCKNYPRRALKDYFHLKTNR
jgi:hypothetical protein